MTNDARIHKLVQDPLDKTVQNERRTTSAREALELMGIDVEEAIEMDEILLGKIASGMRDPHICVCGHPVSRHTSTNGVVYCKPTRMECPCKYVKPVLEVEDLRSFLRKTTGAGSMHALTRGMVASIKKGKSVTWLTDPVCDRCGKSADSISPTPVTPNGISVNYATGYDALLCPSCRDQV